MTIRACLLFLVTLLFIHPAHADIVDPGKGKADGDAQRPKPLLPLQRDSRRDPKAIRDELCVAPSEAIKKLLKCGETISVESAGMQSLVDAHALPGALEEKSGLKLCDAAAAINGGDAQSLPLAKSDAGRDLIKLCGFKANPVQSLSVICAEASAHCTAPALDKGARWRGSSDSLQLSAPAKRVCDFATATSSKDMATDAAKTELTRLKDLCLASGPSGPIDAVDPISIIAMTALQGLGDFLKERAKEEALDFAVERFGRELCKKRDGKISGPGLFPKTCKFIFPKSTVEDPAAGDPDIDGIVSGGFQKAVLEDVMNLPQRLFGIGNPVSQDEVLRTMMIVLAEDMLQIVTAGGGDFLDIVKRYRSDVDAAFKKNNITLSCELKPETIKPDVSCVLMLWLTLVSTAKDVFEQPVAGKTLVTPQSVEEWLRQASIVYCDSYGVDKTKHDGSCLFGLNAASFAVIDGWATSFKIFYDRMSEVQTAVEAQKRAGRFAWQIAIDELPEVASAVEDFLTAVMDGAQTWVAQYKKGDDSDEVKRVRDAVKTVLDETKAICGVLSAALNKDVAKAIRLFLALPFVDKGIDPAMKKALLFTVEIAEAKNRDEARKAIEDIAAPRGTWKGKYMKHAITFNGYVGVFGVVPFWTVTDQRNQPNWPGIEKAYPLPLSAPVGLDFSWRLHDFFHVGMFIPVIDPLALKVTTPPMGNVQVDFDPVLAPGVAFRIGMFKSPFSLMVGTNVRPLVKSEAHNCGVTQDQLCWQAPISMFFGVAVDVPILQLR